MVRICIHAAQKMEELYWFGYSIIFNQLSAIFFVVVVHQEHYITQLPVKVSVKCDLLQENRPFTKMYQNEVGLLKSPCRKS